MNAGAVTATMLSSQSFVASPVLSSGMNAETVSATSGGGTNTTNTYQVGVVGPSSSSLSYDANGNLTSDGTNSYAWNVENRPVQITGNRHQRQCGFPDFLRSVGAAHGRFGQLHAGLWSRQSAVINIGQTATVAGTTITAGDILSLIVHNSALCVYDE